MKQYILALDQGTSSSRAVVFDSDFHIKGFAQQEFGKVNIMQLCERFVTPVFVHRKLPLLALPISGKPLSSGIEKPENLSIMLLSGCAVVLPITALV